MTMEKKFLSTFIRIALVCGIWSGAIGIACMSYAQDQVASTSAEGLNASASSAAGTAETKVATVKIGYVDVMRIADTYKKTKDIRDKIEQERSGKETQIKDKLKELRKLRDEIELMGLESKEDKRQEFSKKVKDLEEYQRQANLELRKEKDNEALEILKEIEETVRQYAKEHGYNVILRSGAVVYRNDEIDITDAVTTLLNNRYAQEQKK